MIEVYVGKKPGLGDGCINALELEKRDLPYLNANAGVLLRTLLLDGFRLSNSDFAAILKQKRLSLEKAAAVAPDSWRLLESLAGYFQCEKAGKSVNPMLPFRHLAIASVESVLSKCEVESVVFWADGLGEEGVRLLAEVCRRCGVDLVLFYRGAPPKRVLALADRVVFGRTIAGKVALEYVGMAGLERELRPVRVFEHELRSQEPVASSTAGLLYRAVRVNLLKAAFPEKREDAYYFLKEVIEGGALMEKSILDTGVDFELYLRLLEYGYLHRSPSPSPQVTATAKGLEAYARYRAEEGG